MVIPDITSDFENYVDNLESVVLTLRTTPAIVRHVKHAHRNAINLMQHVPAGGDVKQGDVIWQFPVVESAEIVPLGSTITDKEGQVWTLIRHASQVWQSKWSFQSRNLSLEASLDTEVDILRATYGSNSDGEDVPDWAIFALNVRAKIQEASHDITIQHGADYSDIQYDVTVESQLTFEPGADYRLADRYGQLYNVLSVSNQNQIDSLPIIRARRLTGHSSSGIA